MSGSLPLRVRIAGTASIAPGRAVTTAELVTRLASPMDAAKAEERTGIVSRHFAGPEETHADLAAEALRRALEAARMVPQDLERIIFTGSAGGDMLSPATANLIAAKLGLSKTCDCFDLNNACMGFLTSLDVAARGIATGLGPVGIAVVELGSRYITPDDPRPYLIFGDAVAAAVIDRGGEDEGILASWLRNDGIAFGNAWLPHPGMTHERATIRFTAPSVRMLQEAMEAIREGTAAVLAQAGVTLADVAWILPHQPNGRMLDAMIQTLELPPERIVPVVQDTGSVAAASIAVSLDRLLRTRPVKSGDRILMVGVGAGISSGAILYQLGACD